MNFNHSFNNLIQKVNKYNLRSFNFQFRIQNDSHFMGQNKKISRYWTRSFLKKLKFYKHIKVFIRSYPRPRYYFRRFKKSIKIYKHVLKTTVNFVKFTTINKLQFKNSIVEDPNVFRRKYIVFIRHRYSRLVKAFNKINKFTVSLAEYNDAKKKLLKKSQLKKKLSLGKVFFRNPWIMRFHRFNKSRINATLRSSLKYQVKFKKRLAKKEINNFLKFMVWFRYYFHKFLAKGKVIKFNDNLKLISVVFKEVVFFYFYFKLAFLSIHSDLTEITKFEQADFSEIYKKVAKEARISSYFKNKRLKWRKRQKKKKSKTPLQLKLLKIVSVLGDVGKSSKKKKKKDQRLIVKQKKKDNKNFNQIFKKNQIQSSSKLKLSESKLEHVLTHFYKIKIPSVREIKKKTKYKKKLKLRSKKTKGNLKTKLNLLIKNKSKNINRKKSMKKVLVKKKINDLIFFKDKRGLNDIVKRFLPKLNKKLVLKFKLKRLKDGEALDYNILRKKKKSKFKKSNRNIQKTKFSKFKKSNINFSYQAPIYVIDLLRGLKIPLPLAFKKFLTLKSKNSFSLLKALGFKILTKDVLKLKQKIKYILQQVKRFYWNLKSSEKTINLKVIKGIYKFLNQLKFIFAKKYFYKMSLRKLVKKIDFCVSGLARFNLKKLIRVKPVSKNLNKNILTFKKSFKLKRKVLVQRNKILTLFNLIKATIIKLNNRPRSGIKKILPYFNYRVLSLNRNGVVIYKALHKSIMNKNFHRLGFKRFMSQFEGLDSINKENLNNGLNYFNTKFKKTFTSSNFNVYQFCEKTTQIDESFYSSFVNWLYLKPKFNVIFSKSNIRPYNLWIFFLNYSINYYSILSYNFFF